MLNRAFSSLSRPLPTTVNSIRCFGASPTVHTAGEAFGRKVTTVLSMQSPALPTSSSCFRFLLRCQVWGDLVAEIKAANTYKAERIITSPQSSQISVSSRKEPVLNFCANNYLGLADNPDVRNSSRIIFSLSDPKS